jgi:succinyl-CoA synthetase beta subunit
VRRLLAGVAIFSDKGEAEAAAKSLPGPLYVVKSQIHAGGRGKGKFKELGPDAKGGVRLAKSVADVVTNAKEMLGNTLVTKQTGDAGKQVNRLYIEDGADIARELYVPRCWSIARHRPCRRSWFRPKAVWISRRSRMTRRKRSSPSI